ncbi:unnamed protein product [Boreogadus saida]
MVGDFVDSSSVLPREEEGDIEDAPVRTVTALSCSTDGNMVGSSVLNKEEAVLDLDSGPILIVGDFVDNPSVLAREDVESGPFVIEGFNVVVKAPIKVWVSWAGSSVIVVFVVESEVGEATVCEEDDVMACTAEGADVLKFPSVAMSLSAAVFSSVVEELKTWTPDSSV